MGLRDRTIRRLRRLNQKRREQTARYRILSLVLGLTSVATIAVALGIALNVGPAQEDIPRPATIDLGEGIAGVDVPEADPPLTLPDAPPEASRPAESGNASYYADKFVGRPTASGEPYKHTAFTAAHRTLPFGTKVRVTRVSTGKSVVVRINDRGPFHAKRVIDLSRAAARELGLLQAGRGRVELEILAE